MAYQEFKLPGFDRPVFVHHNDDWSGMATVEWWDARPNRVTLPGKILLALSFAATKEWVVNELVHALDTKFEHVSRETEGKSNG